MIRLGSGLARHTSSGPGLYIPDRMKLLAAIAMLLAASVALGACGSQGIQVPKTSPYYRGAVLFLDHCSGCHTLSVVGAEGSATTSRTASRRTAPTSTIRKENVEQVLYAIRNGGFSGAIMPENIVVGDDAQDSRRIPRRTTRARRRKKCRPRTSRCPLSRSSGRRSQRAGPQADQAGTRRVRARWRGVARGRGRVWTR